MTIIKKNIKNIKYACKFLIRFDTNSHLAYNEEAKQIMKINCKCNKMERILHLAIDDKIVNHIFPEVKYLIGPTSHYLQ